MPRYTYKAIDAAGKPRSGAIMASNGNEAISLLRREGLSIQSCELQRKAQAPPPIPEAYRTRKMRFVARVKARHQKERDPRFPMPELPLEFRIRRALAPSHARNALVLMLIMTGVVWAWFARPARAERANRPAAVKPVAAPSVTYTLHEINVHGMLADPTYPGSLRFNFHFPDIPFDETRSARDVDLKPNGAFSARFYLSTARPPHLLWLDVMRNGDVVKKWEDVVLVGDPASATLP